MIDLQSRYPPNHQFGMRVPVGGSCCEKCKFRDGQMCGNKYFNRVVGDRIPAPVDRYCCDVFEPAPGEMNSGKTDDDQLADWR